MIHLSRANKQYLLHSAKRVLIEACWIVVWAIPTFSLWNWIATSVLGLGFISFVEAIALRALATVLLFSYRDLDSGDAISVKWNRRSK